MLLCQSRYEKGINVKMLTDEELKKAIFAIFACRNENINVNALRADIKRITGKNVSLRRMMQILNENNYYCVDVD